MEAVGRHPQIIGDRPRSLDLLARAKGSSKSSDAKSIKTGLQRPTECKIRIKVGSTADPGQTLITIWKCLQLFEEFGRGEWIRTTDLLVPNQAL